MEPISDYCEMSNPLFHRKTTKVTVVQDLVDEDQSSSWPNVEEDSYPSDCKSVIFGTESERKLRLPPNNGLIRIREGEMIHETITKRFVSSLNSSGYNAQVESIYRNDFSDVIKRAKLQSFCLYSKAMEIKCDGNANVKYAWYGASRTEIDSILAYGFGLPMMNNGAHGQGVYLSPVDRPIERLGSAASDENGLTHMLLCRVIMGKTEAISPCSRQFNPSSEEFDSGVDDLTFPKKFIVWASSMNTHILPEFVVSFRTSPTCREFQRIPRSDWMPFPTLIKVLSKFLPSDAIELITKHHRDFKKQKIPRHEMVYLVRDIAGDNLLGAIVRSYRGKVNASSKCKVGAARNNCTERSE